MPELSGLLQQALAGSTPAWMRERVDVSIVFLVSARITVLISGTSYGSHGRRREADAGARTLRRGGCARASGAAGPCGRRGPRGETERAQAPRRGGGRERPESRPQLAALEPDGTAGAALHHSPFLGRAPSRVGAARSRMRGRRGMRRGVRGSAARAQRGGAAERSPRSAASLRSLRTAGESAIPTAGGR